MKHLIKHLVLSDLKGITSRSLRNCHTNGLDSIVLVQQDGKCLVRLFVARPEHDLWLNHPALKAPLSIALHPHHCDIALHVVKGVLHNHVAVVGSIKGTYVRKMGQYRFRSAIKSGKPASFERMDDMEVSIYATNILHEDDSIWMPSTLIHTVSVARHEPCACFVYEGRENPNHIPLCWTDNHELVRTPLSGLYEPMTEEEVLAALTLAELI
jgi:hypothetical protein